jgi:hypothetical protein
VPIRSGAHPVDGRGAARRGAARRGAARRGQAPGSHLTSHLSPITSHLSHRPKVDRVEGEMAVHPSPLTSPLSLLTSQPLTSHLSPLTFHLSHPSWRPCSCHRVMYNEGDNSGFGVRGSIEKTEVFEDCDRHKPASASKGFYRKDRGF